jgi:hypothetical protein
MGKFSIGARGERRNSQTKIFSEKTHLELIPRFHVELSGSSTSSNFNFLFTIK